MSGSVAEQRRVWFSGRVQGVGFRYTTRQIAAGFDVSGTVRNLADGRVEILAEGRPAEINGLLDAIREHFDGHITDETSDTTPATGLGPGFRVVP